MWPPRPLPLLFSPPPPPTPRPLAARQVNPEAIPVRRLKSAIYHRATALRGETVHSVASVSIPAGKLMKWIYAMHFISLMMVSGYELRGDGEEVSGWVGGWIDGVCARRQAWTDPFPSSPPTHHICVIVPSRRRQGRRLSLCLGIRASMSVASDIDLLHSGDLEVQRLRKEKPKHGGSGSHSRASRRSPGRSPPAGRTGKGSDDSVASRSMSKTPFASFQAADAEEEATQSRPFSKTPFGGASGAVPFQKVPFGGSGAVAEEEDDAYADEDWAVGEGGLDATTTTTMTRGPHSSEPSPEGGGGGGGGRKKKHAEADGADGGRGKPRKLDPLTGGPGTGTGTGTTAGKKFRSFEIYKHQVGVLRVSCRVVALSYPSDATSAPALSLTTHSL